MESRSGSVVFCVCLWGALVGAILLRAWQLCDGHFGYPIDDSYIHMAMAKNFALHGVWGVTRYGFSSSTSSPLFTLILAAFYYLTGVHELTPFLINCALAVVLIAWCCFVLGRVGFSGRAVTAWVSFLVLATPLFAMTLVGMEHVLHALLSLVFLHVAALLLSGPLSARSAKRLQAALFLLTPFLVMARYEGSFLVLSAGVLFLMRGRWGTFAGLGALSVAPLAAYAVISVKHGWYALPNSLLLKANLPADSVGGVRQFLLALYTSCLSAPHLPLLLLIALGLLRLRWLEHRTVWSYAGAGLTMFLACGTLHLLFARVGWYFRYEAYLVAVGGITLAVAVKDLPKAHFPGITQPQRYASMALVGLLILTLGVRTGRAIYLTPRGIRNIFDQQYQTARFVRQFYGVSAVVVNDIGAVCFLSDAHVLDAIGLGDMAPAVARMRGTYSSHWLDAWSRQNHAELAIAYPDIDPPASWPLLGKWTIPDRWVVGHADVNVYAVDPQAAPALQQNLRTFQAELPRGVRWTGL